MHCSHFGLSCLPPALQQSSCGHAVQGKHPVPKSQEGEGAYGPETPCCHEDKAMEVCAICQDKKSNYTGQKIDRSTWQRTLWDLIPKNDKALVNLLRKDGSLPKWEGKTCPRCGTGKLSALQPDKVGAMLRHRCNAKGCQTYINPHHLHPLCRRQASV